MKTGLLPEHRDNNEYGKAVFAEQVVKKKCSEINFEGFEGLLSRLAAVIQHYHPPTPEIGIEGGEFPASEANRNDGDSIKL